MRFPASYQVWMGLFVPAHINRKSNGIYSQLGFMPGSLKADALEVSMVQGYETFLEEHPEIKGFRLITNSDSHLLEQVGLVSTDYYLEKPVFEEIAMALRNENGRKVRMNMKDISCHILDIVQNSLHADADHDCYRNLRGNKARNPEAENNR